MPTRGLPSLVALGLVTVLAAAASLAGAPQGPDTRLPPAAQRAALRELVSLVSIPNVATDAADIRKNAEYLRDAFARRGFAMQIIETRHSPILIGERRGAGRTGRTLTFYCHYDGQPVIASEWPDSGPFQPILRDRPLEAGGKVVALPADGAVNPDWRLYARSSSDDKGPIAALLAALDLASASGRPIASTLRLVLEGDEEAGSPVLEEALKPRAADVKSDLVIMMDGPQHLSGRPTFFFGARGILSAELVVFGARRDLHSGNYGNWAPNPALELARLLASMKDEQGRVTIDGFYDDVVPLNAEEKQAIADIPPVEEEQMKALGFARPEVPGSRIEERHNLPTLNVSGLGSGTVTGQGRTIIPATATARLDLRMVNAHRPREAVRAAPRSRGEAGLSTWSRGNSPPTRSARSSPGSRASPSSRVTRPAARRSTTRPRRRSLRRLRRASAAPRSDTRRSAAARRSTSSAPASACRRSACRWSTTTTTSTARTRTSGWEPTSRRSRRSGRCWG